MSEENVGDTTSQVVPMADSMFAQAPVMRGGTTLGQEPSIDETTPKVEETTVKTQVEASNNPGESGQIQNDEVEGDAKHSSKVISELGEDRKKIIQKFVDSAKKSGVAADDLKDLMASDERIAKLVKTKFGDDYDALMADVTVEKQEEVVDVEAIKKKAKLEAQLEAMQEEDARLKAKQFELFAQSSGLNSEESEAVKENAELLEGKYSYEEALQKALLLVNRDKAVTGPSYQPPTGGQLTAQPEQKTEVTQELRTIVNNSYGSARTPEQVAEGIDRVAKRLQPNGSLVLSLED